MRKPHVPLPTVVGRLAAELAVIVAGVLIALAAQSWWEDRQLDEERAAANEAVASDLESVLQSLESDLGRIDTVTASIAWMLDPATDYAGTPDSLWSHRVRYALWEISGSRVALSAYEELKGSGRLGLLDAETRAALARLEGAVINLFQTSDDNFQYQIRNLDPWLLDNAPLREILRYDGAVAERRSERFSPGVLESRRVENMLLAKLELVRNLEDGINDARAIAEEVLRASPDR